MSVKAKTALFRNLLYIQEIILHRRISVAAEKNGIKASNLSHIVREMEQRLGRPLFYRNARGLTPTEDALKIAGAFVQIERLLNNLNQEINPQLPINAIKLHLPESLTINGLCEFANQNNLEIGMTNDEKSADVIVSYQRPAESDYLISVENKIGNGIQQTIWVCAIDRELPLKLARFIISQMHAQ